MFILYTHTHTLTVNTSATKFVVSFHRAYILERITDTKTWIGYTQLYKNIYKLKWTKKRTVKKRLYIIVNPSVYICCCAVKMV